MSHREIVIRIQLPRAPRRRWLVAAGAFVVLVGGAMAVAAVTWPASHAVGSKLSGSDLDAYLNNLNTRVAALTPVVPTWTNLTLLNSWVPYPGYQVASYTKTPDGMVHLRGLVRGGTAAAGTPLATLPVGYRPALAFDFAVATNAGGAADVDVEPNGNLTLDVALPAGPSQWVGLDGIVFFAEQ